MWLYRVSSLSDRLLHADFGGEDSMLLFDDKPSSESLVVNSFKGSHT